MCICCRDIAEGQQPVFEFPFSIEGDKVRPMAKEMEE
jgi:hypothetical protein